MSIVPSLDLYGSVSLSGRLDALRGPAAALAVTVLAGCATPPDQPRTGAVAQVQRTANGVAHVQAPDLRTLAFGVAYAHAQDNVCQTAQQLVTLRGERARWFGTGQGLLGLRALPNEQVDTFVQAHMDDEALARAHARTSADAQDLAAGYVEGYNRYLSDHSGRLPAACNGQPWVRPMTLTDYRRAGELSAVQAGIAIMADAWLGARPPTSKTAGTPFDVVAAAGREEPDLPAAEAAMREIGLVDPPLGSNAWAFGAESTPDGRGLLLGNPHFPWQGTNRFWQMHLTVPGQIDVMGAGLGLAAVVQIGFNKDVAWSHTVSTGKRFTLHELALVPADPTRYLLDGQPMPIKSKAVTIEVKQADGQLQRKTHTVWTTHWGPVVAVPRAGLNWTEARAYALRDANAGNARMVDTWLGFARAASVADMHRSLGNLGLPWVNTIAADRHGSTLYADVSVVPDVDAAQLQRCAPSAAAAGLLRSAVGLAVLDGSRSDCDWRRDSSSAVPGLIPMSRLPVVTRRDWVQNANDSYLHTHPAQTFPVLSPLIGDAVVRRARTRSSLSELPELLAGGKATRERVQARLFANRNLAGRTVLPDLLAACGQAPGEAQREGCRALAGWDGHNNLESRAAHLFREFWRQASAIPGVHGVTADPLQPVATPRGLKMGDAVVAAKVWDALGSAVAKVRSAGLALDAALGEVQRPVLTREPIGLHGGDDLEGVLNNLGARASPELSARGIVVDYGTSYVQTVGFDERGPVADGLLVYGQSTDPASPHAIDQLRLFSRKVWPRLPFHADDVARERQGPVLQLTR